MHSYAGAWERESFTSLIRNLPVKPLDIEIGKGCPACFTDNNYSVIALESDLLWNLFEQDCKNQGRVSDYSYVRSSMWRRPQQPMALLVGF